MYTQDLIASIATRYGVPVDIALAVAYHESRYNQSAVGSSGEIGVYQIMPGTAVELGIDPRILEQNIEGGIRYLRGQYDRFGNWADALAAYNAGASRVASGNIPSSTVGYVDRILGTASEVGKGIKDTLAEVFIPDTGMPTFSTTATGELGFGWWVLGIAIGAIGYMLTRDD